VAGRTCCRAHWHGWVYFGSFACHECWPAPAAGGQWSLHPGPTLDQPQRPHERRAGRAENPGRTLGVLGVLGGQSRTQGFTAILTARPAPVESSITMFTSRRIDAAT
jgi:hypothetical protein